MMNDFLAGLAVLFVIVSVSVIISVSAVMLVLLIDAAIGRLR